MTLHTSVGLGVAGCWLLAGELKAGAAVVSARRGNRPQEPPGLLADGAMEGVQALFACMCFQAWRWRIGVRSGSLTAAAGELEVEVLGGRRPMAPDPTSRSDAIWMAAGLVRRPWQEAIKPPPRTPQPVVVSFGRIEGGKAFNVIATTVALLGNRSAVSTPTVHAQLAGLRSKTPSRAICRGYGGEAKVRLPLHCTTRSNTTRPHGPGEERPWDAAWSRQVIRLGAALPWGRKDFVRTASGAPARVSV